MFWVLSLGVFIYKGMNHLLLAFNAVVNKELTHVHCRLAVAVQSGNVQH